jgi:uncharacterized protein with NRDE domain
MCVVALAIDSHPRWKLLLAANRDELHARASDPLARWEGAPHVLAGRDLVSGGSWLGVSEQGRLAVLTNIRSAAGPDPAKATRGALVADWLVDGRSPDLDVLDRFNGFSLILSGREGSMRLSNVPQSERMVLAPGIHGLSNGQPHEPWPRKQQLEAVLAEWLKGPAEKPADLLRLLSDEQLLDADGQSIFIRAPVYGTRCSTIVAIDTGGRGEIIERRFKASGVVSGNDSFTFRWPV